MSDHDFLFVSNDTALDFLNTRVGETEYLRTTDDLVRWLNQAGLVEAGETTWRWNDKADPLMPQVKRFRHLLEEVVETLAAGKGVSVETLAQIDSVAAGAPLSPKIAKPSELLGLIGKAALDLLAKNASGIARDNRDEGPVWVYTG